MIERRGAAVAIWRLAHLGGRRSSERWRLIRCPGVGWPVRIAAVRAKSADVSVVIVAGGEAILLSRQGLALDASSASEGGGADVLVGAYLFASDQSRINGRAIGDAVIVVMVGHMAVRVAVPVGEATVVAMTVIHDMLVLVARPVEMLVAADFPVIAGVIVAASMVMIMSHVSD